jgi:hypothetical protein
MHFESSQPEFGLKNYDHLKIIMNKCTIVDSVQYGHYMLYVIAVRYHRYSVNSTHTAV